eukprot:9486010-Pyramimonas_sp.AAC.1
MPYLSSVDVGLILSGEGHSQDARHQASHAHHTKHNDLTITTDCADPELVKHVPILLARLNPAIEFDTGVAPIARHMPKTPSFSQRTPRHPGICIRSPLHCARELAHEKSGGLRLLLIPRAPDLQEAL